MIEEFCSLSFINSTINGIRSYNGSSFILITNECQIKIDSCKITQLELEDSYFLNTNSTIIQAKNNIISNISIHKKQKEATFIKSFNGKIYITETLIYENNFTKFLDINLYENNEILINKTIFKNNNGNHDNIFTFLGCNQEIYFKMQNLYFTNNQFFEKMIYISQIKVKSFVHLQNISLIQNPSNAMLHCSQIDYLKLDLIVCSNNFYNNISSGPCLKIENVDNFFLKKLSILGNVAVSNLNGIQILSSYTSNDEINKSISKIINYLCHRNIVNDSDLSESFALGNCMNIDSNQEIFIEQSYFIENLNQETETGSPCIFSKNNLAEITINNSFFYNNKAFKQSNCIYFGGFNISIFNSHFEAMMPYSNEFDLWNAGAIVIASEQTNLINVSFFKNQAFKGASIFFQNFNGKEQKICCEKVYKKYFIKYLNF